MPRLGVARCGSGAFLGESLEERFPQAPFRPFYTAKTSVLAGIFLGAASVPRLGPARRKFAALGPSSVVRVKPDNPLGAPEAGGWRAGDDFAKGLAEGVTRGRNLLHGTNAYCASGRGPLPAASGCGPLPAAAGTASPGKIPPDCLGAEFFRPGGCPMAAHQPKRESPGQADAVLPDRIFL